MKMLSELKSVFLWLVFKLSCTSFSNSYNERLSRQLMYILSTAWVFIIALISSLLICCLIKLIIKLSFELTFWIQLNLKSSYLHFQLNSSWIKHIFNSTWLDSTRNRVNSTWFIKNLNLMSRKLNIEIFPIFCFCIIFLHYLFDRKSWKETWWET